MGKGGVLAGVLAATLCTVARGLPVLSEDVDVPVVERRGIRYSVVTLPPMQNSFLEHIGGWKVDLLANLNRCNPEHLKGSDELVLPHRWDQPEIAYSPFPHSIEIAKPPKLLILHQPRQVFGAYEYGRLVRWGPVSSGREGRETPSGLYHLNWKSRGRHSTVDPDWYMPWYFNFHNERGLSLHQFVLPCRPASHACVRLLERDARWLYEWGEEWELGPRGWEVVENGTPFLILGEYDFESEPPWLDPEILWEQVDLSGVAGYVSEAEAPPED